MTVVSFDSVGTGIGIPDVICGVKIASIQSSPVINCWRWSLHSATTPTTLSGSGSEAHARVAKINVIKIDVNTCILISY